MKRLYSLPVLLAFLATGSFAQEGTFPAYQNLRFEEDWSTFDPEAHPNPLYAAKHLQLSEDVWVSVGGKLRLRLEGWDNSGFVDRNDDLFMLGRVYLHSDWHLGEHWRVFVEGRYTNLSQRDLPGGKRPALDVDRGDVWNAFVEGRFETQGLHWRLRVGRQELQFGKQRLVSPLDWSNNRRIFDAALLRVSDIEGTWNLTLFTSKPVVVRDGWWTWNETNHAQLFSGIYYSRRLGPKHTLDAYLFANNSLKRLPVEEDRHTLGLLASGTLSPAWSYSVEGALQSGKRSTERGIRDLEQDIEAWMIAAETTYTFGDRSVKPWVGIGLDYASGDGSATDRRAETFNQLYPLGHAYLGYADYIGRQNIIAARVSAGFWPIAEKLKLQVDLHSFWLARTEDGLYNAGGAFGRSPTIVTTGDRIVTPGKRHVGEELDITLNYFLNRHLTLQAGYSLFNTGSFLDSTGPKANTEFVYSQMEITF